MSPRQTANDRAGGPVVEHPIASVFAESMKIVEASDFDGNVLVDNGLGPLAPTQTTTATPCVPYVFQVANPFQICDIVVLPVSVYVVDFDRSFRFGQEGERHQTMDRDSGHLVVQPQSACQISKATVGRSGEWLPVLAVPSPTALNESRVGYAVEVVEPRYDFPLHGSTIHYVRGSQP